LWGIAGVIARRAARPLLSLVDVTRRIGEGDLQARPYARHTIVEIKKLSDAIGEMAERIEQQMKDQRALLAGASHELRTPLGHLRILVELLRTPAPSGEASAKVIDDVEREVVEMDALVGKLLASARLDFSMADKREVDAVDLARRALERVGEPIAKLVVQGERSVFTGDPTLVLGAIGNLLENARSHGVSVVNLTVEARADEIAFVVDDAGAGIAPDDEERVFEPFFHKDRRGSSGATGERANGSLGLGLALVKRIAIAHGGRAFATTRSEGGGRVGFTVARR
jgi:two-component system, OmpR family, sensor kinase